MQQEVVQVWLSTHAKPIDRIRFEFQDWGWRGTSSSKPSSSSSTPIQASWSSSSKNWDNLWRWVHWIEGIDGSPDHHIRTDHLIRIWISLHPLLWWSKWLKSRWNERFGFWERTDRSDGDEDEEWRTRMKIRGDEVLIEIHQDGWEFCFLECEWPRFIQRIFIKYLQQGRSKYVSTKKKRFFFKKKKVLIWFWFWERGDGLRGWYLFDWDLTIDWYFNWGDQPTCNWNWRPKNKCREEKYRYQ